MRKIISLVVVIALCFTTVATTAFAMDNTSAENVVQTINEYDYITELSQATAEELAEMGMTQAEANNVVCQFEDALMERATLPDSDLIGMGYTADEISSLRSYAAGARLVDAEVRGLTGTCTGNIKVKNCGTKYATFYYTWEWDHCPIMTLSDSAAVRWLAYDTNGYEFSIIQTGLDVEIDYYWNNTLQFTREGEEEPGLEFNTVNIQFDVTEIFYKSDTIPEEAYAKNGKITISVKVDDSVNNEINYILVAGLYGHTTVGAVYPSVSLSPGESVSIDFSGNLSIDSVAAKKAKINRGSTITYL